MIGTGFLINKIGPMIPGASSLGSLREPVLAIGAVFAIKFAAKHVGFIAKHKEGAMIGAGLVALRGLINLVAPASVKAMLGMGDYYDQAMGEYVGMGDYLSVGADPIDDDIAMADYIAVGSDGVEEELGLGVDEELGVEEELGNDLLGGVSSSALMKQVPTRQFLEPVPARSFTKQIGQASAAFDNPGSLYQGVFRGGF